MRRLSSSSVDGGDSVPRREISDWLRTALVGASIFGAGSYVVQIPVLLDAAIAKSLALTAAETAACSSVIFVAWAVGATLLGRLSDTIGRKKVSVGSACAVVVHLLMTASSRSLGELVAARALGGFAIGGLFSGYTLGIELSEPAQMSRTAWAMNVWFTLSVSALVGTHFVCAHFVDVAWRLELAAVAALLGTMVAAVAFFVPDSPHLKEEEEETASSSVRGRRRRKEEKEEELESLLSKGNRLPFTTLISTLSASSLIYYLLTFEAGAVSGSLELNIFLLALLDLPGSWLAHLASRRLGNMALPITFLGCAASLGGLALSSKLASPLGTKTCAFAGKLFCSAASQLGYLLPTSFFSPELRSTAFGLSSSIARLVSTLVPSLVLRLSFARASALSALTALFAAALAARLASSRQQKHSRRPPLQTDDGKEA